MGDETIQNDRTVLVEQYENRVYIYKNWKEFIEGHFDVYGLIRIILLHTKCSAPCPFQKTTDGVFLEENNVFLLSSFW